MTIDSVHVDGADPGRVAAGRDAQPLLIADAYAKLARLIAERRRSLCDDEDGDG
jgi:hypothetical protein